MSRKTTRKVRAVEVPFGGQNAKKQLNDLFKLVKGTFHLLESVLSDLKGGRGLIFCVADCALIMAYGVFVR